MSKFPNTKGQALMIDLAFAVFIFTLLFAFLYGQWQQNISSSLSEQAFVELETRASRAVDSLIASKGIPQDWHLLPLQDVNSLGLAKKKRVLSLEKVSAFAALDYNTSRTLLKLSDLDFYFRLENSKGDLVSKGLVPDYNSESVSLLRIVDYNGVESVVEFAVFRR